MSQDAAGAGLTGTGTITRESAQAAQVDLVTVLQMCASGGLRCSEKTRRPSSATVAALTQTLCAGDFYPDQPIAAFAWPLLVQAGGLAELSGGRLTLSARGRAALAKPPAQAIRHLWQRWVSHGLIDELSRVEEIKGQRIANVLTSVKGRRQAVAAALAGCPPGDWVDIDDLFTTMRRGDLSPVVARNERSVWKLYIADREYGSLGYAGFHDWPVLEGRYTLCVLFEYAATLGLIDVAYTDPAGARQDFRDNWGTDDLDYLSRYDGLRAIRVNPLGAYALGLADHYHPPTPAAPTGDSLKVLPNLDIVAVGEIGPADRLLLDAVAARTSERVWSLSTGTLLAAVGAGRTVEELRRLLADRCQHGLPATVARLLDDVAARTSQVVDRGVCRVVECANPALAALISHDRTLRTVCRPLGDRHLAVPIEHETAFRNGLQKLGYLLPTQP